MCSKTNGDSEHITTTQAMLYHQSIKDESTQSEGRFQLLNHLKISQGSKVLDLGCGTGNITFLLAERVGSTGQVIGVDPDKKRIDIAKESNKRPNVTFLVGDDQSFPEDQYDIVFTSYVLHWIKNKQAAFQKIASSTRPGGQFAMVVPIGGQPIADEMTQLMGPEGKDSVKGNFHVVPAEKYNELAIENGFNVTFQEKGFDIVIYPSPDTLLKAWMAITHGAFNPEFADQDGLARFKEKYSGKPIEWKVPVVRYILTKI